MINSPPKLLDGILLKTDIPNIGQSDHGNPPYVPSEGFKVHFLDKRHPGGWLLMNIVEVCHKYQTI